MNHSQEQISILLMDFHIEETSETIKTNRSDCNLPQMIQIQKWLFFRQMGGSRLNSARRIFGLSKFRINRYQNHPRQVCLPVNHSGWWFGTFIFPYIGNNNTN